MFTNYVPAADLLEAARAYRKSPTQENGEALDRAVQVAAAAADYSDEENEIIEKARTSAQELAGDDLEIDDKPALSHGEDGCWVSAWLHVPAGS